MIGRLSLNVFCQTQCIFIVPLSQINTWQLSYFFLDGESQNLDATSFKMNIDPNFIAQKNPR